MNRFVENILKLLDGIISFNVARKYIENDPTKYDPFVVKPIFVSGKYAEYINNLEILIEGIYSTELKSTIFKYTLKTV